MSIKDLFGKTSKSLEETVQDVESVKFVEEKTKKQDRYLPPVDFSDPKNFVYYGSAELYYDAAIRRIYEDYPYDGSKAEQIEFEEKSSNLERWLFENKYPKTTGHVQLGTTANTSPVGGSPWASTTVDEYIRVWGGLHTNEATELQDKFSKSAKYDNVKNRNQNWNCDFNKGITAEFWLKKDNFDPVNQPREVVLDLWNGEGTGSSDYGRVVFALGGVTATTAHVHLTLMDSTIQITSTPIDFSSWHHYAFSVIKRTTGLYARFYVDGDQLVEQNFSLTSVPDNIEGKVDGFIGALQHEDYNGDGARGHGKLSAYLDEFRFWKTERTARKIKLNWFSQVGGGANTDDATSDLGVYLKFNEGIVGNTATDSVILDYSGRLANGLWVGYPGSSARSTDSAIETLGYTEPKTPIIYSNHPSVVSLVSEMQTSGSNYDSERGQAFFNSMPNWLQQDDNGNLRKVSQILGSYLDTLHVQIKQLTELKNKEYPQEGFKASTMSMDLLEDKGFMVANMFGMNEVYEKLSDLDIQDNQYESEVNEIKNIIYTNIYNNLEKIYKSKGTETSIRNFIRCFGIDDELIKLNLYTDNGVQYLSNKSRVTSVKKKYINFNHPDYFSSTIYQTSSVDNPNTFISGSSTGTNVSNNAFTLEADIVVPYKKERGENGYFGTPFVSSSVFGFHEANESNPSDYTFASSYGIQVYLVKDSVHSRNAKFILDLAGTQLESDYVYDIYENTHWNIAVSIKPETYPYAGGVTNTTPDYQVEFYAVSHDMHEESEDYNEVGIYASLGNADGAHFLNMAKRAYAGAHIQNFTGSVLQKTDIQVGAIRAWLDYLDEEEIREHNKDILNYGSQRSIDGSNLYTVDNKQIPTQDLTILNWDFDTVLTSNGSGQFDVEDTTSGSTDTIYGWVDDIIRREHKARGDFFPTTDTGFLSNEFLYALKKQLPETAYNSENIFIKGEQQINFSDDDDVSDNLFVLEKSPANLVSEEMLKSFSTTMEFANLIGRPIDRYRIEYKDLAKARELFFNRVESDLDFDRFFEYFKWIDSSVSSMVNQLIPLSANFAGGIVDVVEPHILERDKYQRQIGLLNTVTSTEASIRGTQELNYNWKFGHAPVSGDEADNCLWQKERKERPDTSREEIRQVIVRQTDQEFTNPINLSGSNGVYQGQTYATRRFSKPYSINIGFNNSVHGGINYNKGKNRDFFLTVVRPHGDTGASGAPKDIVTIGAGDGHGLNALIDCNDIEKPNALIKRDGEAQIGKFSSFAPSTLLNPLDDSLQYLFKRKLSTVFPGNIVSSSVNTGYASAINKPGSSNGFKEGVNIVNLHSDTTDITNEIPIQGPFTQQWIGGHQSRHVNIATGPETLETRPEAWRLLIGQNPLAAPGDTDGAMGFTGPDYGAPYPVTENLWAIYYREERAKRPVNIKNIKTLFGTASAGNYVRGYEVFSTFGDQGYFLRRHADVNLLPERISDELPQTTNYMTLIGQEPYVTGNVFGVANNNRQPENVPAFAGVSATGSFKIYETKYVDEGDTLSFFNTSNTLELDPLNNGVAPGNIQIYGATDVAFWADLSSSIEAQGYSVTTSSVAGEVGRGMSFPHVTVGTGSLYASASVGTDFAGSDSTGFSISTWFLKPDNLSDARGWLFNFMSGSASENRTLSASFGAYIDTIVANQMVVFVGGDSSTGWKQNEFRYNTSIILDNQGAWKHLVFARNAGTTSGDFKLFMDGVWQEPLGTSTYSLHSASSPQLGDTDGKTTFFNYTTSSTSGQDFELQNLNISNIAILKTNVATAQVPVLYNKGFTTDISGSSLGPSTVAWYKTGYDALDNIDPLISSGPPPVGPDPQGFFLKDVVGSNDLSGSKTGDNRGLFFLDSLDHPAYNFFEVTASSVGTFYNGWNFVETNPLPELTSFFDETFLAGGVNSTPQIRGISITAQDRTTGSVSTIRTKFSAPGGPEINTSGYLDIATQQYSVYSSLNFRNLTVRMTGSGEQGTMRVNSQAGRREGLRMLRTRHQGQFGIDSLHGVVSSTDYVAEASFNKQHRNTTKQFKGITNPDGTPLSGEVVSRRDNAHFTSLLPGTEFQYSWINSAISGSNWEAQQKVLGFAPSNGLISSSVGITEAIVFPTISQLYGE